MVGKGKKLRQDSRLKQGCDQVGCPFPYAPPKSMYLKPFLLKSLLQNKIPSPTTFFRWLFKKSLSTSLLWTAGSRRNQADPKHGNWEQKCLRVLSIRPPPVLSLTRPPNNCTPKAGAASLPFVIFSFAQMYFLLSTLSWQKKQDGRIATIPLKSGFHL